MDRATKDSLGKAGPAYLADNVWRVGPDEETTHQGQQALLSLAQILVQIPRQPEHGGKPRCVAAVAALCSRGCSLGRPVPWVTRCGSVEVMGAPRASDTRHCGSVRRRRGGI
jgi:hypothetical protein